MSAKKQLQTSKSGTIEQDWKLPTAFHEKLADALCPDGKYAAEDCDCQYCLHISERGNRCIKGSCVYMPERLCAGCVPTDEMYGRLFSGTDRDAFSLLTQKKSDKRETVKTLFLSKGHRDRWHGLVGANILSKSSPHAFASALFLLTADRNLWDRTKFRMRNGKIMFRDIDVRGVNTSRYAVFKAAKELYGGDQHLRLSEMADPSLLNDNLLRLIINAIAIRRYGIDAVYT